MIATRKISNKVLPKVQGESRRVARFSAKLHLGSAWGERFSLHDSATQYIKITTVIAIELKTPSKPLSAFPLGKVVKG